MPVLRFAHKSTRQQGPVLAGWLAGRFCECVRHCNTECLRRYVFLHVCVKIDVKHARANTCKRAHVYRMRAFGLDEKLTFATSTKVCFYTRGFTCLLSRWFFLPIDPPIVGKS